jgi:colanic acid/amylovoran biosynthesis protein
MKIKALIKRLLNLKISISLLWLADRFVPKPKLYRELSESKHRVLVLAPASGKNLGDQAMLKAVAESGVWDTTPLLTSRDHDLENHTSTSSVAIPKLLSLNPVMRLVALRRFIGLLSAFDEFVVVGADTMDGIYSGYESVMRLSLIRTAQEMGLKTRLMGFSWSATPNPRVLSVLSSIARDCLFIARDEASYSRLQNLVPEDNLFLGSDLAFSLAPPLPGPEEGWVSQQRELGRRTLALNINGHQAYHYGLITTYGEFIEVAVKKGWSVLFINHDFRPRVSDLAASEELLALHNGPYLAIFEGSERFEETRRICQQVDFVVTGRMHVGILAMGVGTCAAIIEAPDLGKVRGLLSAFDLDELRLNANDCSSKNLSSLLDSFEVFGSEWQQKLLSASAKLYERSLLNFTASIERRAESLDESQR